MLLISRSPIVSELSAPGAAALRRRTIYFRSAGPPAGNV